MTPYVWIINYVVLNLFINLLPLCLDSRYIFRIDIVAKCWPILLHFWLGNHCIFLFQSILFSVKMLKSMPWLWLELCFILFDHLWLFVFLLASPNMYMNTKLDLALIGSLSGAWHLKRQKSSNILATRPCLAILTATVYFGWPRLCNSNFSLDVSNNLFRKMRVCEIALHSKRYTS